MYIYIERERERDNMCYGHDSSGGLAIRDLQMGNGRSHRLRV